MDNISGLRCQIQRDTFEVGIALLTAASLSSTILDRTCLYVTPILHYTCSLGSEFAHFKTAIRENLDHQKFSAIQ